MTLQRQRLIRSRYLNEFFLKLNKILEVQWKMTKKKSQVKLVIFFTTISFLFIKKEPIVIIKKQEIMREIGEATNPNLNPTTEKKIQYEKYVDNPDKYLKQK